MGSHLYFSSPVIISRRAMSSANKVRKTASGPSWHLNQKSNKKQSLAILVQRPTLADYNITISLMLNQQSERQAQIFSAFNSILSGAVLAQIDHHAQEKLINLSQKPKLLQTVLKLIKQGLGSCQQIIVRLKILCILQQLISHQTSEKSLEVISSIISRHETQIKGRRPCVLEESDTSNYLQVNVELPYLFFLRKMICWQTMEISWENGNQIDLGFTLINKIKDIVQLKKIFHNFGCYYPNHLYAVNMFRSTLSSIKKIWNQICYIVKDVTIEAIRTNSILAEEYLLICAAEEIQDMLMEFVYGGYFCKKINRDEKIKYIAFIKPQIKALEAERRKKSSSEKAMKELIIKRDSRKELELKSEKITGESESVEERINTAMEMEILDSIFRLQSLLSQ